MRYDLRKRVCAGEVPPAASSKRGTCTLKHIFIINPSAGKNDSRQRIYTMAEALREKHGLDVQCMLTASVGHAATLARGLAESGEEVRLYACGGDGTVNEVANGIAGYANAAMTCIPIGTGNDFLKNFGADYEKFLDAENLWNGETQALDLIDCNGKYCLTIDYTLSRILPSVETITTSHGISFPLFSSAFFTACSIPPQQGTSIRTTVMLRMSLCFRISVSLSE